MGRALGEPTACDETKAARSGGGGFSRRRAARATNARRARRAARAAGQERREARRRRPPLSGRSAWTRKARRRARKRRRRAAGRRGRSRNLRPAPDTPAPRPDPARRGTGSALPPRPPRRLRPPVRRPRAAAARAAKRRRRARTRRRNGERGDERPCAIGRSASATVKAKTPPRRSGSGNFAPLSPDSHRAAGDPGRIRTCDLLLRRQLLYPAELRSRVIRNLARSAGFARRVCPKKIP
jgi:hypothetical protein